jgi:toxin ParE1/3/4
LKAWYFSDRAEASFDAILEWTFENYGGRQLEKYRDTLLDRCRAIAAGQVVHQSCRAVFADDLREDLRFARAGQHYVIFLETEAQVQIVDFLHQAADISGRLG